MSEPCDTVRPTLTFETLRELLYRMFPLDDVRPHETTQNND